MWFLLVFKNLKLFIKNKPVLFVFIIITQIVCVLSALTVAGMIDAVTPTEEEELPYWQSIYNVSYGKYNENIDKRPMYNIIYDLESGDLVYNGTDENKSNEIESSYLEEREASYEKYGTTSERYYSYSFNMPDNYTELPKMSDVRENLDKVIEVFGDDFESIYISGYTDDTYLFYCNIDYGSTEYIQSFKPYLLEQESSIEIFRDTKFNTMFKDVQMGDTVKINNTNYIVTKINEDRGANMGCRVLYSCADDDFIISSVSLLPNEDTTQEKRAEISELLKKLFGYEVDITDPEPIPLAEKQFNNMVYVVSFILIAVVLLNIARLYTYIMSKRQKTIALCQLCGADKFKSFLLYITEIVITLIVTYIVGVLIFHYGLVSLIALVFPTFAEFFTIQIYANIFIAYVVIGIVIITMNLIPLIRKTIIESKKGAK